MAIAIGNKTNDLTNPLSSTTITYSHTHNTGDNGLLLVCIGHSNDGGFDITDVTYNGVAMTKSYMASVAAPLNMDLEVWVLASPATGANNVVITFDVAPYNPVSSEAISFTGAATTLGNNTFEDIAIPPVAGSITISDNSIVTVLATAGTAGTDITIAGSSRTIDWNNLANNYVFGALSETGFTAGSKSLSVNALAQLGYIAVEVKEAAAAGSRNTQAILLF